MKSLQEIKETFTLLQKIEGKTNIKITELAKELGENKLKLMDYILNNPKLIVGGDLVQTTTKPVRERYNEHWQRMTGKKYFETTETSSKNFGFHVSEVYTDPSDNYRTDEWLEKKIEENKKYIYISESDNYGYIQGYYVPTDIQKENDKYRYYKWRNTEGKIKWLKDNNYLHSGSFIYGGFGDSYSNKHDNIISLENINKLKELGWKFNNFKPLSK